MYFYAAKIMISQKSFEQITGLSVSLPLDIHFRSTVYTNTTPTVIIHSYVFQKPPFYNDNGYKV